MVKRILIRLSNAATKSSKHISLYQWVAKPCNATLIQFARMLVFKRFFSQGKKKRFTKRAYPRVNYKDLPQTSELHKFKCNYYLGRKRESVFFTFSPKDYPLLEVHKRLLAESNLYFVQTTKAKLYISLRVCWMLCKGFFTNASFQSNHQWNLKSHHMLVNNIEVLQLDDFYLRYVSLCSSLILYK